jgi:hypothetical protein
MYKFAFAILAIATSTQNAGNVQLPDNHPWPWSSPGGRPEGDSHPEGHPHEPPAVDHAALLEHSLSLTTTAAESQVGRITNSIGCSVVGCGKESL